MVDWVPYHVSDADLERAMRAHGYIVGDDDMPRSEIEYLSAPAQKGQRYGTDTLRNRMTRIIESVVVDLLEGTNVHVSGSAGMGKSVLVRNVRDILSELTGRPVITCAPTGIAAVNVDGQTVYSEFGGSYDIVQFLDEYVLNLAECPDLDDIQQRQAKYANAAIDKLMGEGEAFDVPTTEYGVMHPERFKVVRRPKGAATGVDADEKWWRTYNGIVGSNGLEVRPEARPGCHLSELMAWRSPEAGSSSFVDRGYDAREFVRASLEGWAAPACIIIDEVSMCSAWQFEAIAESMRKLNGRLAGPGLRVPLMVVGDFMQLCPVVSAQKPDKAVVDSREGRAADRRDEPPAGISVKRLSELSRLSDRRIVERVPRFHDDPRERWARRHPELFDDRLDDEAHRGYYAFDSHLWDEMGWSVYELTQPLRQRDEASYAMALRLVRIGDSIGLAWIADHMDSTPEGTSRQGTGSRGVSEIHGTNEVVCRRNRAMLDSDPRVTAAAGDARYIERVHEAWAHETGESDELPRISARELPVSRTLRLAEQAYVMLTRNGRGLVCVEKATGAILSWPAVMKSGVVDWDYDDDACYIGAKGGEFYNGDRGRVIGVKYDKKCKGVEYALVEIDDRTEGGRPVRVVVGRMQLGIGGDYLPNPELAAICAQHIDFLRVRCGIPATQPDSYVLWRHALDGRSQRAVCKAFPDLIDIERANRDLLFNQWAMAKLLRDDKLARDPKRVSKYHDRGCDYLPMALAYAYTYHKSQGQTLGMTDVDVNGVFAFGQFYVGVSRCEKVGDLRITGLGNFDGPTRFALLRYAMDRSVSREARAFDAHVTELARRHATDEGLRRLDADVLRAYTERYPERERDRIAAVVWAWLFVYEQRHSRAWTTLRRMLDEVRAGADGKCEPLDFAEIVKAVSAGDDATLEVSAAAPDMVAEALRRGWPQRFFGVDAFRCAWLSLYTWLSNRLVADVEEAVANFDVVEENDKSLACGVEQLASWRTADVSPGGRYVGLPNVLGVKGIRDGWFHQVPVTEVLGGRWFQWFEPDDRFYTGANERDDKGAFRFPDRIPVEDGLLSMAKALGFDADTGFEGDNESVSNYDFGQNAPNRV